MDKPTETTAVAYADAQAAMASLKSAVYRTLLSAAPDGLRNVDVGRALGIHAGHVKHEGHTPRALLAIMESEGVVEQDSDTKLWQLKSTSA